MRLIIVDDQVKILRKISEMLGEVPNSPELVKICCNKKGQPIDFPGQEEGWYFANNEDRLFEICRDIVRIRENDCYLLDVTLFEESQIDKQFSEYMSVRLAQYIESQNADNIQIKFYTRPFGISVEDFANETIKWGSPIYRPKFERDGAEVKAKEEFITEVEEYWNV